MFCLGDRVYGPSAFCAAGRKLAARLVQLSAKPVCNIGYGDDGSPNGGVFNDLDTWLEKDFLQTLIGDRSKQSQKHELESLEMLPESAYCVKLKNEKKRTKYDELLKEYQMQQFADSYNNFFASLCPATTYAYDEFRILGSESTSITEDPRHGGALKGCIVSNDRITGNGWMQDTRHIRMHVSTIIPDKKDEAETSSSQPATNCDTRCDSTTVDNNEADAANKSTPLPYMAGDIATIMPSNPTSTVDRFLSCLPESIRFMADTPFNISTNITAATQYSSSFTQWPKYATLRGILTHCADISNLPEREDLRALRFYCNPSHPVGFDQRKKLISLSETANSALYGDYILREKRNWADVLFDFDSIKFEHTARVNKEKMEPSTSFLPLTIEHLLMILPPIMPRHFSIASAPSALDGKISGTRGYSLRNGVHGFDLELCVAVVQGTTRYGRSYKGLCSSYLSSLKPSDERKIRVWVRPGSFSRLPMQLDADNRFESPVMYVGAGTGIAPLRSLIQERETIRMLSTTSRHLNDQPDNILVFGSRKKSMDYYYGIEWGEMQNRGNLRVLNAFSQDQKHKLYVQKVLREADGGLLIAKHLLENNGALYIAGGAKMAQAVKDEVIECLGKVLPSGEKGGKIVLQKLQRAGRFSVEAWS